MANVKRLPVWNTFDEFGLEAGLGHWTDNGRELKYVRYPGETNDQLRERVLDSYNNKADSSYQGLINALSRDLLTDRYNGVTQYHYILNNVPYPQSSGIKVYSSGISGWDELYPQVRSSGYTSATSGWIVWNEADIINSDGTTTYGDYNQVLEFIGTSLPDDETPIKIEYEILNRFNEDGEPELQWVIDKDLENITDKTELRYNIIKETIPTPSSQIVIHRLNKLATSPFSGQFYTDEGAATSKLKEIATVINNKYPAEWGKIPWNSYAWENTMSLSQGVLPTLFDAEVPGSAQLPSGDSIYLGGTDYGPSLYLNEIVVIEEPGNRGAYAHWYPLIYPGKFYISNSGYYLFENKQSDILTLTNNRGTINFNNRPNIEDNIIIGYSGYMGISGEYFSEVYSYPYGTGLNHKSDSIFRRTYRIEDKLGSSTVLDSGSYYIDFDNYLISGIALSGNIEIVWEDPSVSGIGKIISGLDLNPYNNDRESSILFIG